MKNFILPSFGVLAALAATGSILRTQPHREVTDPPSPPPESRFEHTVAAVGLVEASSENISIGSHLSGVVEEVLVTVGQAVKAGEPLFKLDDRHLRAQLANADAARLAAEAREAVTAAELEDLARQLDIVESLADKRAVSLDELTRRRSAVQTAQARRVEAMAQVTTAAAQVEIVQTEIERSTVKSPTDGEVLQVKLRAGEFALAGPTSTPMILLGKPRPLHLRVDVDEHEGWRVRPEAHAVASLRGNAVIETPLQFVRFEPFVLPKRSLTGDSTERVDTRVLQVIYRIEQEGLPLFVGQQMDVFIDAGEVRLAGLNQGGGQ